MPLPVCVRCKVFFRVKKNSFAVIKVDRDGTEFQLWDGDEYECPACRTLVVGGFGQGPLSERHHDEGFEQAVQRVKTGMAEHFCIAREL